MAYSTPGVSIYCTIYATINDRVEEFKNKKGEIEARTIEGEKVCEMLNVGLTPGAFHSLYTQFKRQHPTAVVRFGKEYKPS